MTSLINPVKTKIKQRHFCIQYFLWTLCIPLIFVKRWRWEYCDAFCYPDTHLHCLPFSSKGLPSLTCPTSWVNYMGVFCTTVFISHHWLKLSGSKSLNIYQYFINPLARLPQVYLTLLLRTSACVLSIPSHTHALFQFLWSNPMKHLSVSSP